MPEKSAKKHYIVIEVDPEQKESAIAVAKKEGLALASWARRTLYKELKAAA